MSLATLIGFIIAVLLGAVLLAALIFAFTKIFGLTFVILRNIFRFIGEEVTDVLRLVGALLAAVLFAPLVILSIVIGRWSASKHYAGALMSELHAAGRSVYRIAIGNFGRLLGLSQALEGVERRVPEMMAAAPTRDKPSKKRIGMFEGYNIVGSLKGGGSGGKLYIAEPDEVKQAVFAKRKLGEVDQVVIKVFSLKDGSSLPQIVRESRALDAARQLGLVLEHQMASDRFYYVMRYVPGESLSRVTQRLHALSPTEGLGNDNLRAIMGYAEDLLVALDTYHNAELWHKDVKPDNIIVDGTGQQASAHLVDFGLITPMRSAMTLTTHGTEYFRDPELVRQALRGVKVHQIDGSKFDVYGAGAVLFSMIENSFPAHGGLSQLTKRCPEALRWIVRRSMAEYDRRYPSAAAMLTDLRVVLNAEDPFKLKPIDLPSVSRGDVAAAQEVERNVDPVFAESEVDPAFAAAGSPVPPRVAAPNSQDSGSRVGRPQVQLASWWSGRYRVSGSPVATPQRVHPKAKKPRKERAGFVAEAGIGKNGPYARVNRPLRDPSDRMSAADQRKAARKRVNEMRQRAGARVKCARSGRKEYSNTPGVAVVFAGLLGMAVLFGLGVVGVAAFTDTFHNDHHAPHAPATPLPPMAQGQSVTLSNGQNVMVYAGDEQKLEHTFSSEAHTDSSNQLVDIEMLIVPMLSTSLDSEKLKDFKEHLVFHGVDLIEGDDSIDLIAGLHNAIGATPIDSPELSSRVQQWSHDHDMESVLILGTTPEYRRGVGMLVVDGMAKSIEFSDDGTVHMLNTLIQKGYGAEVKSN